MNWHNKCALESSRIRFVSFPSLTHVLLYTSSKSLIPIHPQAKLAIWDTLLQIKLPFLTVSYLHKLLLE